MKKLPAFLALFLLIPTLLFATVSDNYAPEKYTGNGSTDEFSFNWTLIDDDNIRVYLEEVSTGTQTAQTLDIDFTVDFDDDTPGGTVTFTTAPTSSYYVIIGREIEKTQSTPYTTSSGFRAKVVEASLDKLTAQTQDLQEQVDRAIKVPIGSDETPDYAETIAEASTAAQTAATAAETAQGLAETAQGLAEDAQAAAEAAAAGLNLPTIEAGDADKILQVNATEDGYDLNTLDGAGAVAKTGNQTIAGVKTFSSFPVIPSSAPTTDYQAANKKYVDDSISALGGTGQYDGTSVFSGSVTTSWTDLDLSSVVGSNRALVLLKVKPTSGTLHFQARTNGDSESIGFVSSSAATALGGGVSAATISQNRIAYIIAVTDSSGIIEHKSDLEASVTTQITLIGYMLLK